MVKLHRTPTFPPHEKGYRWCPKFKNLEKKTGLLYHHNGKVAMTQLGNMLLLIIAIKLILASHNKAIANFPSRCLIQM